MQFQLSCAMDTNTAPITIEETPEAKEERLKQLTREFRENLYTLLCDPVSKTRRSKIVGTQNTIGDLKSLLEQGADVNASIFEVNNTFLIEVCNTCPSYFENNLQHQLIELLLSFSANPNQRDAYDKSAVAYAAGYNNSAAIEQLVKAGASVHGTTHITPCHLACYHTPAGAPEALSLLLSQGASVNGIDYSGRAPIHYALESFWRTDELSLLLEHGAHLDTQIQEKRAVDPKIKIGTHPNPPSRRLIQGFSPFHQAAQLYKNIREDCDAFNRKPIPRIKKLLLYHALFYGTIDHKSMFTLLCSIRRVAPGLYHNRYKLLIPYCKIKPLLMHNMIVDQNTAALYALTYRAQELYRILMLQDSNGQTAHDIEKASIPDIEIEGTTLFNPQTLGDNQQRFLEAVHNNTVEQLSTTNPFEAAWSLVPPKAAKPSLLVTSTTEKSAESKCIIC